MSAIPKGYKQTEVGVIPLDWEVCCLGDLLAASPTYGINAPAIRYNMEFPTYLRITDISQDGGFIDETKASVEHPLSSLYYIELNDIVFARTGASVGKSYLYDPRDGKLVFAGFLIRVKPDVSKLNPKYLKYFAQSTPFWCWVNVNSMRSGQPGINGKELSTLPLITPTLKEQTAIADALSDADALIASLVALIDKKQSIKQGAMQELLTGKRRLAGFSGDWAVKRLGDVAEIYRGASPRPIESPIWFDDTSSVGWVRISDVTKSNKYLIETTQRLSNLGISHSRFVPKGSLIMSICATVGKPVVTDIDVCIHDGFVVFEKIRILQDYLFHALKMMESEWSKTGQTGSQMNLNTGIINPTPIQVPNSTEEQTAIATLLSDMDLELAALAARLDKARAVKAGMMDCLLTGKVRLVGAA